MKTTINDEIKKRSLQDQAIGAYGEILDKRLPLLLQRNKAQQSHTTLQRLL